MSDEQPIVGQAVPKVGDTVEAIRFTFYPIQAPPHQQIVVPSYGEQWTIDDNHVILEKGRNEEQADGTVRWVPKETVVIERSSLSHWVYTLVRMKVISDEERERLMKGQPKPAHPKVAEFKRPQPAE